MIREYQETDLDQVTELWNLCFSNPGGHNSPHLSIQKKTAMDDGLFFVSESQGRVDGTVMAGWDGHRGWIYSMAVHPEKRRNGTGSALVDHALDALSRRGCLKVNLQVLSSNTGVLDFYEKLGFKVEERISMGKHLPPS